MAISLPEPEAEQSNCLEQSDEQKTCSHYWLRKLVIFSIFRRVFIFFNSNIVLDYRGSAIAKIIGLNVTKFPQFEDEVRMYVYEEIVDGRKLSEIINSEHENVKYLPGKKLPDNIVCRKDSISTENSITNRFE